MISLVLLDLAAVAGLLIVWAVLHDEQRAQCFVADRSPAQLMVVFGAQVQPTDPSPELAARLDHALRLHQILQAPIAISGGCSGATSEVAVMSDN